MNHENIVKDCTTPENDNLHENVTFTLFLFLIENFDKGQFFNYHVLDNGFWSIFSG